MKNFKYVILALVLIVAVGTALYQFDFSRRSFQVSEVLPAGPIFYSNAQDISQGIDEFFESPFWQEIKAIRYEKLLKESFVYEQSPEEVDKAIQAFDNVEQFTSNPLFAKFFGQEMAIAVYPFEVPDLEKVSLEEFRDAAGSFAFVTRLEPEVQFFEVFLNIFKSWNSEITTTKEEYQGRSITLVQIQNVPFKFGYVKLKDLVVLGVGSKMARQAIDAFDKRKSPLNTDENFKRAKRRAINGFKGMSFVNLASISIFVEKEIKPLIIKSAGNIEKAQIDQINESINHMAMFPLMVQSINSSDDIKKHRSVMYFDKSKLDSYFASIYSCEPTKNTTTKFIPRDASVYKWGNCSKLDKFWSRYKDELRKVENEEIPLSPIVVIEGMEKSMGLDIENDILPAFGDTSGGYLNNVDFSGAFPIPQFLYFIEVRQPEKAEHVLEALTNNPLVLIQNEEYQGIPLKLISLPIGVNAAPGYAFFDNYLLISSNAELIKQTIDISKEPSKSIQSNPYFQEKEFTLNELHNGILYLRADKIVQEIKAAINWGLNWSDVQSARVEAFESGAKLKLRDLQADIKQQEMSINEAKTKIAELENELAIEQNEFTEKQLESLQVELMMSELELADLKEKEPMMIQTVTGYQLKRDRAKHSRYYIEEVLYPILNAFATLKVNVTTSTMSNQDIEVNMYSLME